VPRRSIRIQLFPQPVKPHQIDGLPVKQFNNVIFGLFSLKPCPDTLRGNLLRSV
jgi:hypothetical protein